MNTFRTKAVITSAGRHQYAVLLDDGQHVRHADLGSLHTHSVFLKSQLGFIEFGIMLKHWCVKAPFVGLVPVRGVYDQI